MPVLMVSEKTCPQCGFSRNRSMRPSSRVMTMPNSSGFSMCLSATVPMAPDWRWNATSSPRSTSVRASPEMTRKVSWSCSAAFLTLPAVPSGAVAEVVAHLARQELDGDDDVLEAMVVDVPDDVLHHRPVAEGQHRLGLVGGEGPQASPLPAGHDH